MVNWELTKPREDSLKYSPEINKIDGYFLNLSENADSIFFVRI